MNKWSFQKKNEFAGLLTTLVFPLGTRNGLV